jgi:hypothetical protein
MSVSIFAARGLGRQDRCLGYYRESIPDGEDGGQAADWEVKVAVAGEAVTRVVTRGVTCEGSYVSRRWSQRSYCPAKDDGRAAVAQADGAVTYEVLPGSDRLSELCRASAGHDEDDGEVIWPTWPGRSQDEAAAMPSPLADAQDYWSTVGNRLRDSAKWTAVALGAALATVIGTSPLAGMRDHRPQPVAILLGTAGLIFLGVTMLLVLQVMRPQSVSFGNVQEAKKRKPWLCGSALYKWRKIVEEEQDLYLPCGVRCLTGLRQSMIVEEITLVALSRAARNTPDQASHQKICQAQAARAARLRDLRAAAAMVATVGEYYTLRYRSSWATYGGILCGLSATAAIVLAFAWPVH